MRSRGNRAPSRTAAGTPRDSASRSDSPWGILCTTALTHARWTRCSWPGPPWLREPVCCSVSPLCLQKTTNHINVVSTAARTQRMPVSPQTLWVCILPLCIREQTGTGKPLWTSLRSVQLVFPVIMSPVTRYWLSHGNQTTIVLDVHVRHTEARCLLLWATVHEHLVPRHLVLHLACRGIGRDMYKNRGKMLYPKV